MIPDEFVRRSEVEALVRGSMLGLRFATVTGVSPLRVHLDGDPGPLPITPITTTHVSPGDWVLVAMLPNPDPERTSKRAIVLSVIGGGSAREATAEHVGTVWTGRFRIVRIGHGQGILTAWFRRTATSEAASTDAEPVSTGLTPNSVLPAWAHITGTGVGDITLPIPAGVSGGGVNQTVHVYVGAGSVVSYRAQQAFTWTPSVFASFSVPVDIADD